MSGSRLCSPAAYIIIPLRRRRSLWLFEQQKSSVPNAAVWNPSFPASFWNVIDQPSGCRHWCQFIQHLLLVQFIFNLSRQFIPFKIGAWAA